MKKSINFRSPGRAASITPGVAAGFFRTRGLALAAAGLLVAALPASAQTLFTEGDLVVSTYGNVGNAATSSNFTESLPTPESTFIDGVPTPISLLEFSPTGAVDASPLVTFTLPTANIGLNFGLVGEYGSSSEANIQLSGNDEYLTIAGYSAAPSIAGIGSPGGLGYFNANPDGVDALAQSTSTNVPRVFATVDAFGNVNSTTILNNVYSTNNPRSEYLDGSSLYISGQGSGTTDQGLFLTSVGTNTVAHPGTGLSAIYTTTDTRITQVYNGNLYYSVDKKNKVTGIFEYTGTPTGLATATQIIPGNNSLSGSSLVNYSPDGYFFANTTTLYVADTGDPKTGTVGDGGIQRWSLNVGNNTWTLDYTLIDANFTTNISLSHGETGFESITGEVVGSEVDLFAVSYTLGDADPDGLYTITDSLLAPDTTTGASIDGNYTELEASGANDVYKSVSFAPVPEPGTYASIFGGLGAALAMARRKRGAAVKTS
jgi:hypothetical protein